MRRIALIISLLAASAAVVVTSAGAADNRTYQAELYNAFGLVEGSELRVAGVKAGTVTGLDTTEAKTALITFEVGPEFPELNADASCSSEPQSLIAEYFFDCQTGSSEEPLTGPIPAARNQTTVQTDLVQNTLREPFKRRFQLLINEFGTALVGNAENLNAAIRAGAPALQQLKQVLNILGRQNRIIAGLNSDSDAVFAQLTDRREDVVRFIDNAGTASCRSSATSPASRPRC
jgi:ABC-type transporter Mla subunit MlaD